ncbi:MAG: hypothetical protein MJ074_06515 [Oscillospiraceae bacterium]|nr:hypothetical protein [Oscillospiraceae bacterium]
MTSWEFEKLVPGDRVRVWCPHDVHGWHGVVCEVIDRPQGGTVAIRGVLNGKVTDAECEARWLTLVEKGDRA